MKISTEDEYVTLLREAETLMGNDPAPESPAGTRLLELATLLEEYEREHYPMSRSPPVNR